MYDWEMLEKEAITDAYLIKTLFGRISGTYPKDFAEEGDILNGKT
ncbi:hypothetical protein J2Z83_003365 [Virgibacillus natechei]|uniref:Uncharacterized protein n=1 Tax=Virgibacillus natechei TaxID=1216297 RepID=A0ABS4ILR0_9BACI|nr:hypothetical protein [Virgibacillus natechei]